MNSNFLSLVNVSRWITALIVVMYHVRFLLFVDYANVTDKAVLVKLFYFITSLGQEALAIYIVLSGMVLGGLSLKRWRWGGVNPVLDLWRKSTRIYAILVPALLIGGLFDLIGNFAFSASGVYTHFPLFSTTNLTMASFFGNLLMLQRFMVPSFGSNGVLFILAYEAWAYLIFAVLYQLAKRHRYLALVPAGVLATFATLLSPEFFTYLLLWSIGLGTVLLGESIRFTIGRRTGLGIFIATLLVSRFAGAAVDQLPGYLAPATTLLLHLLLGLGFALMLLSFYRVETGSNGVAKPRFLRLKLSRGLAQASLALYASHFPFMMILVAAGNVLLLAPVVTQPRTTTYLYFVFAVAAIYAYAFLLSGVTDRFMRMVRRRRRPSVACVGQAL
jgi:peptidoglycan/LPS O-acetylase OafA/YrhL